MKYFLLFCTLTWPVNNFVSRQEKHVSRRNESTRIVISGSDVNNQSSNTVKLTTINQLFFFSQAKNYDKNQFRRECFYLFFPSQIATLRNKRKLAAVNKDSQEEHPRKNVSRETNVPRVNEDYIAQVSKEIEGRVTKIVSGVYQDRESDSRRFAKTGRFPSELTSSASIRNRSGDFREMREGNQEYKEDRS